MNIPRCLAFLLVLGIAVPAFAQDDWTGKRVVLKRPGIRIGYTDDDGNQVYITELTNLSYSVQQEDQGFLRVTHRGSTGWFPKKDALLPADAIKYFTESARLAPPTDGGPFAYLGWAHREKGEFDLAIAAYDSAIKRDPRADWYNNRGLLYLDTKKLDEAITDFTEAIKRAPKFVMAYENRAAAYGLQNKPLAALENWSQALSLDPDNAGARLRRARIYLDQKEFDKGIADLSKVVQAEPKNAAALIERGQAYADLNKTDDAIRDFSAALAIDGKNAEAFLVRAQLYTDKKDFPKALADAEEALKLSPTLVDAVVARGWSQFLLGEFDKANADFARAIEMNGNHPGAYNSQAWLWATCPDEKFRDGKKAVEFAKKAVELTQGKEPAILDTQAAALAETGAFDQAIRIQEQVVQAFAGAPQAAESQARLEQYRKNEPHRQKLAKSSNP